ncbi:alpha/beta fold hydrolase [Plastoroseomonas hellenica]|nr:alpha/beta hydrolase [Plastoroseomonas hellenica]
MRMIRTPTLDIACETHGPEGGPVAILLHGFPYGARDYDKVAPVLAVEGWHVLVPHLRGHGPTHFLREDTPRSGQQAALGQDLLDLMDALAIEHAVVAGYDWGGRAACIAAALAPERVTGLLSCNGYNIQDIPNSGRPAPPARELRYWYQWYFHTERGATAMAENPAAVNLLLWQLWSPDYNFTDEEFDATAALWQNPDYAAVVIQSYRHRHRAAPGDPAYDAMEAALAQQPLITVPTVVLHGESDNVDPPENSADCQKHFTGRFAREVLPGIGHCIPREAPEAFLAGLRALKG